jgi:anti-sigma regulatory factor (Ser/Thr protein kinase)
MLRERLPKEPVAAGRARRMLDRLDDRLTDERLADARLLISEIVTNAVEHVEAEGDIEVVVEWAPECLRIEVLDPGHGFEVRERDPHGHRGWGLQFVQHLADRWGVGNGGGGRVWFEMTA